MVQSVKQANQIAFVSGTGMIGKFNYTNAFKTMDA